MPSAQFLSPLPKRLKCQRLLQPTGRFRRRSLSLVVEAVTYDDDRFVHEQQTWRAAVAVLLNSSLDQITRMENPPTIQTAKRVAWGFATLPLLELLLFYSFVVRARLSLSFWPSFDHPDPKSLGFILHYDVVTGFLIVLIWSVIPVLVIAGVLWLVSRRLSWWVVLVPVMVSFAGAFALHHFDPGGFFEWFMD